MAENTFFATSCSNNTYSGILNGGETSWSRTLSGSGDDQNMGIFYINPSLIESTIPANATISKIVISHQFKQNRSNTNLYISRIKTTSYTGGVTKLSQQASEIVGDSYVTNSYTLTDVSRSELANTLSIELAAYYKGMLSTTQYLKDLKAVITWSATESVKKVYLGSNAPSKLYLGGSEVSAAYIGNDSIYKA